MAEKVLDVVIFGASGFTGKYVIREMLKFQDDGKGGKRRIGIAGRSKRKLADALTWAGGPGLASQIPIIEADVSSPDSLSALCKQTRLVISCVGPYRKYGEPVVAACVDAGVDYLDITGEPEFIETMELKYHDLAVKNGSLVVSACGYDSIPAETGALYTCKEFASRGWIPNSVDSFILLGTKGRRIRGNFGTYESAILGLSSSKNLAELRKRKPRRTRPKIPGLPATKPALIKWEENSGSWGLKLPSADPLLVRKTQSTLAQYPDGLPTAADAGDDHVAVETIKQKWRSIQPAHYGCYLANTSLGAIIALIVMAIVWTLLAQFSWGKKLLLEYPTLFSLGTFSKNGPTEEEVEASYFSMWFVGKGYNSTPTSTTQKPDKQIVTRITGPEIGYITTPICLIQAALVVLDERKFLPQGGVWSPGAAFAATDLQERLEKAGLHYEVVSVKDT